MTTLMLRLLGIPHVDGVGSQLPTIPLKAFLAAALVDLRYSGEANRAGLAAALWPDAAADLAHRSLRQLLLLVRRWEEQTGALLFQTGPRHIYRGNKTLTSDAAVLMHLRVPTDEEGIVALSKLYAGELLAPVDVVASDLGQWVAEQRDALQQRFVRLALDGAEIVGGPESETLLRRLGHDLPYDEEVERGLLHLLARERPAAVREAYESFARRLRRDLNAEPSVETRVFAASFVPTIVMPVAPARPARRDVAVPSPPPASRLSVPRVLLLPPTPDRDTPMASRMLGFSFVDDLTLSLCSMRSFAVYAPHTARQLVQAAPYRGALPYAADYVVETRLFAFQGYTRLAVTMADTASHEVLFAETLTFAEHRLSAERTQLISALVGRLTGTIDRVEQAEMRRTGEASAYVHFLMGNEQIRVLELANIRRARKHFRRAAEMSAGFTGALSMTARSLCLEWVLLDRQDKDLLMSALELAGRAVRIDPHDPSGHRELGHAKLYLDALDESVGHLAEAVERAPHHADILVDQADAHLHSMTSLPRARQLVTTALELNPLAPDAYNWIGATIDFFLGDGREAMTKLMRLDNKEAAARLIAAVAASVGDDEMARKYREVFMSRHPDFRLADWYMPMRGEAERQRYLHALRRAGFS